MSKFIFCFILLFSFTSVFTQELNEFEIKKTRSIQEQLISNPEKAYTEALEISNSKNELFSFFGKYYIANYFYNKSDYTHSKQLLIVLIDSIEKSDIPKSSKVY